MEHLLLYVGKKQFIHLLPVNAASFPAQITVVDLEEVEKLTRSHPLRRLRLVHDTLTIEQRLAVIHVACSSILAVYYHPVRFNCHSFVLNCFKVAKVPRNQWILQEPVWGVALTISCICLCFCCFLGIMYNAWGLSRARARGRKGRFAIRPKNMRERERERGEREDEHTNGRVLSYRDHKVPRQPGTSVL